MRCVLVVVFPLLAACEPVYVRADYVRHPSPRQARSFAHDATPDSCFRDPQACPAPPQPFDPAETHRPSLLPYKSGADVPSYD
jgi:hypothetical protein